jgi:hypothetical protein
LLHAVVHPRTEIKQQNISQKLNLPDDSENPRIEQVKGAEKLHEKEKKKEFLYCLVLQLSMLF